MMRGMFTAACFFTVWLSVFFFTQTTSIGGGHKQETSQTLESSQDVPVEIEMPKIIITTFENNETTVLPEIPLALETTVPSEKEADNQTIPEMVLYLTFDDGPSIRYTTEILDVLKEKDIKATFFVVGENVRKYPEIVKRIAEEGHTIGIHCNSHRYEELYESVDSYLQDFNKAYEAVVETAGVEPRLFRFPGGSINAYNSHIYKELIARMEEQGFIYFDWNASLEDSLKKTSPEELLANAKSTAANKKYVVLLAHDIVGSTAECLEDLIEQFQDYQIEPLTPEVKPVQFREKHHEFTEK